MKLIYITNARIPTEKAHGLQIMKMCEAFALANANDAKGDANYANSEISVELIIPKRINPIEQDPFEYYGVKKVFNVRRVFCVDLFRLKFVPAKISFYLQSFSFSKLAVIYAFFKYGRRDNIFYSRDYITLFFLCLFGFHPVAEIHDYRSGEPRWWLRFILRKVKKIIVNSEGTLELISGHYKLNSDKCLVAPNGVDVDFFDISESKEEARSQLKMPENKAIVGYVGRLETSGKEKGVLSLLRAFGKLLESRKDCLLYIVGGPNELVEKYKSELGRWGVSLETVVFTGQAEYKKIPLYLKALDILVITAPDEARYAATTSPIKLFEFLAAGKAIVAPDLPAWRACLNEGNAVFFDPASQNDLAEKIQLLLDNQSLREKLARQAYEDVKQYAWDKRAERISDFVTSLG